MEAPADSKGFSLKEAAALIGVPEAHIRKAIEAGTIEPRVLRAGRAPRYLFHSRDLLALALIFLFPLPLPSVRKREIWNLFRGHQRSTDHWRLHGDALIASGDVPLQVDLKPLKSRLFEELQVFRSGRSRIVRDPSIVGGDPVFEGTRIPLAHIVGLLRRGVPYEEIREDYPRLSEGDLAYAALVARMKPDPGRPRKPLTLVRTPGSRPRLGTRALRAGGRAQGATAHR